MLFIRGFFFFFFFTVTKGEAALWLDSGLNNPDIRIILDGKATKENFTHENIKCQWQWLFV